MTTAHALKGFSYPYKFPITSVKVNYDSFPIHFLHFKFTFFRSLMNQAGTEINLVFRNLQLYPFI